MSIPMWIYFLRRVSVTMPNAKPMSRKEAQRIPNRVGRNYVCQYVLIAASWGLSGL